MGYSSTYDISHWLQVIFFVFAIAGIRCVLCSQRSVKYQAVSHFQGVCCRREYLKERLQDNSSTTSNIPSSPLNLPRWFYEVSSRYLRRWWPFCNLFYQRSLHHSGLLHPADFSPAGQYFLHQ